MLRNTFFMPTPDAFFMPAIIQFEINNTDIFLITP